MKTGKNLRTDEPAFLFTLDVLVQGRTNGHALERLMALLNNSEDIADYRVTKGVRLGHVIEEAIRIAEADKSAKAAPPVSAGKPAAAATQQTGKAASAESAGKDGKPDGSSRAASSLVAQISQYIANRTLVRLSVVRARGIKLSIPCRILNYDESVDIMTVYHVDEKKVYSFKLAEIDDLTVN